MVRLSPEELDDLPILLGGQTVTGDNLRGNWRLSKLWRRFITHADAPCERTPRQWTKRFSGHLHCRGVCCRHLPDEASGRKRSALRCTRRRYYRASHWDWPTAQLSLLYRHNATGSDGSCAAAPRLPDPRSNNTRRA